MLLRTKVRCGGTFTRCQAPCVSAQRACASFSRPERDADHLIIPHTTSTTTTTTTSTRAILPFLCHSFSRSICILLPRPAHFINYLHSLSILSILQVYNSISFSTLVISCLFFVSVDRPVLDASCLNTWTLVPNCNARLPASSLIFQRVRSRTSPG